MYLFFRRIFEIILSLVAIILLLPLFIIVIILIKLTSKGPAIFRQKRVGKNQRPFIVYKFRTMKITPISEPDTVTILGNFLRKSSIDELPQLFNVLFGSMSIIGPRPSQFNEIELIKLRESNDVYSVKPGITGWAQVNGRRSLKPNQKTTYDAYYVKNQGLKLDIMIIFKTIYYVLSSKNINEDSVTE